MEPPPSGSVLVSFSDTLETCVCGCRNCQTPYGDCSQEEKTKWKLVWNSCNTSGDSSCWLCGKCWATYQERGTTHWRGVVAKLIVTSWLLIFSFSDETISIPRPRAEPFHINKNVAAVQRGRGMATHRTLSCRRGLTICTSRSCACPSDRSIASALCNFKGNQYVL